MAKIIYRESRDGKVYNYIAGTVSFIAYGSGEYENKVTDVGMTLEVYNPNTHRRDRKFLSVAFWNGDSGNLAERLRKAKVRAGSFVLLKCGELRENGTAHDGTPRLAAFGFRFSYSEVNPVSEKCTIVCGVANRCRPHEDGLTISVPVSRSKDEAATWYNITFKDGVVKDRKITIGTRSLKAGIVNGLPICVLCGAISNVEEKGKTIHNLYGYDFCLGFTPNSK